MKTAKFFLVLLLIVAVVLILALGVVWGLNLGLNKPIVDNAGYRIYSSQDREEILAAMKMGASSSTLSAINPETGERQLTAAGQAVFKAMQASPVRQYAPEERQEILGSLKDK
jgi:hypothetical protein